jgi:membrane protein DedA with SNARE-associated domain
MDTGFQLIGEYGYRALFLLLMLGIVGLPIPDEALLMFVGYLVFRGRLAALPALGAAWAGSIIGITISYVIGRIVGPLGIPKLGRLLRWKVEHIKRAEQWVRRWGGYVLVLAYFLPGVRHLGALIVGASGVTFGKFARFAYVGAFIWVSTFLSLGYLLGEEWSTLSTQVHKTVMGVAIVAALLAIGTIAFWRKKRLNKQTELTEDDRAPK